MGAGRIADIAAAPDRRRPRARHAGRRGPQRHPARPADRPHDARRARATPACAAPSRDRRRRRRRRSTSPGSSRARCSAGASSSTRAREQASELRARLEELGAEVIELPSIAIEPVEFDAARPRRATRGWCSRRRTASRASSTAALAAAGLDARALAGLRVAAIGPGTAAALAARGLRPDLLPERFVAESLLEAFPRPAAPGERVLLARAEQAPRRAPRGPRGDAATTVDVLAVYRTVSPTPDAGRARAGPRRRGRRGHVHVVVDRRQLLRPRRQAPRPQPLVVSIGPVTRDGARARACGSTPRPTRTRSTASSPRSSSALTVDRARATA